MIAVNVQGIIHTLRGYNPLRFYATQMETMQKYITRHAPNTEAFK